jgi:signal peptidase II
MNKKLFTLKNIAYLFGAMFFVADLYLKSLATRGVWNEFHGLLGHWFGLKFTPNALAAFSLPVYGWILVAVDAVVVLIILIYLIAFLSAKIPKSWEAPLLVFLLLGAISNLIDRLRFHYVIDYLDLKYFTVFNVADIMITIGVAGLILIIIKTKK